MVQAGFDVGEVTGYGMHVDRLVLEVFKGAEFLDHFHLPLLD